MTKAKSVYPHHQKITTDKINMFIRDDMVLSPDRISVGSGNSKLSRIGVQRQSQWSKKKEIYRSQYNEREENRFILREMKPVKINIKSMGSQ